MADRSQASIARLGAISIVILLIVMAAAFNLQNFPGFRGTSYKANFTDASGLAKGDMVQIAGIRVGKVDNITIDGTHVTVDFDVHGASFGTQSAASVQVLNLLGQKFLNLTPKGGGQLPAGATIPLSRTDASYDIVGTLGELTDETQQIDTGQLSKALTTLAGSVDASAPEVQASFTGLSRLSHTIASRNDQIHQLLVRANGVTSTLAARRGDLVTLMKQGTLIFQELDARHQEIHSLLINARRLATSLHGIAADNQAQIGGALRQLHGATVFLRERDNEIESSIKKLAPYASTLINVIGTGPWFDAYVPNLAGIGTGEFTPGSR